MLALHVIFSDMLETLTQPYLSYGLSDETSYHQSLCVDEQVGFSLSWSAQSHLLEPQLIVRYTPHILSLKANTQK